MPNKTINYKLEYFKQGSYYSSGSDVRRFLTLDYNLESYVGVVGIGIISGWTINDLGELNVEVLPGKGIISGFFSESPYIVKQRSDMVDGDREVEVFDENDVTEPNLTPSQRTEYVRVIRLYNSSFNPSGDIVNAYVKTVIPSILALTDNKDNYIYAMRPVGSLPYPALSDYPPSAGYPPVRNDYENYDQYEAVLNIYNGKIDAIHDYEWYLNSANHFTEVEFIVTTSYYKNPSRVLLARVMVRNAVVKKIDTSLVDSLSNMNSKIRKFAKEYIGGHIHGGSKFYDPSKIRLETDIRDAAMVNYDDETGRVTFDVLEKDETSIYLGHKHTYEMDSDGNGQTIDQIGSTNPHFHKVDSFVVGNPEYTIETVEDHIHTVETSTQKADTWTNTSSYVVYVNDEIFGDETTSYIHASSQDKSLKIDKGISALANRYYVSFDITILDYETGDEVIKPYYYEALEYSVYRFMLKMIVNYNAKFIDYYTEKIFSDLGAGGVSADILASTGGETTVSNIGIISKNLQNHPFDIKLSDGSYAGLGDLESQSTAAQLLMKEVGDAFTFTPNAARNITIKLLELGAIDKVKIEILGNTEVTGTIPSDNILYLNANKILTGEFIPSVIPFVSHIGRLEEECLPLQYALSSNDGYKYDVVPSVTDVSWGHSHKLLVDSETGRNNRYSGVTTNVLISNQSEYYGEDDDGNSYYIQHAHGVSGEVMASDSVGLLNWQNNVNSSNLTSSSHTHNVVYNTIGNNKVIYSIKEDIDGNIYVGTSDGFIVIPNSSAYLFVINGVEIYFYGNDLWNLFEKAVAQYESETGYTFYLTEDLYQEQVEDAIENLVTVGSSVLMTGQGYPDRETDQVMIKRISSFKMPDLKYTETKESSRVLNNEIIISTNVNGEENMVTVERYFDEIPIWSIDIKTVISPGETYIASLTDTDIVIAGYKIVLKSSGLNKTPYRPWTNIDIPFSVGIARRLIRDSGGNFWVCTNNGVLVSRNYSSGQQFEVASLPGGNPDIKDIIEGETGGIYCVSYDGVFKTLNEGKTWSRILDVREGFKQIVRDKTLDKTNVVDGHYHNFSVDSDGNGFLGESIGSGTVHIHKVTKWDIDITLGHSHTMIATLYVLDNNSEIWKSTDNGSSWINIGSLPDEECGDIYAAFGYLFVSTPDGLYRSVNCKQWTIVFKKIVYSYEMDYNLADLYVGCDGALYVTSDGSTFDLEYQFDGFPSSVILKDEEKSNFGYAYSNYGNSFYFKDFTYTTGKMTALVDFSKWYAINGLWDDSYLYDVYVNYKRVLSSKYNEDKRSTYGYYFNVVPTEGLIDFSASAKLTKKIDIYDASIYVDNSVGFYVGDVIVIEDLDETKKYYAKILAINSNIITLESRFSKDFSVGSSVKRIPNLDGNSSLLINIYNSLLSNIGVLTHDQIEDGLSNFSDGRPYKLNDSYLSNLLQLTQAVRYVYPDINSEFINSKFYDFRYSWSPTDPVYPYIYDYIDVLTSEIYNKKIYDSDFVVKKAKSINKILIGYGYYDGTIIVATDIGIFWARMETNMEANWFYIYGLQASVYDLIIFGEKRLFAATSNGTYYTTDMTSWTLESNPSLTYPSYSLGLRWADQVVTNVASHDASFVVDSENDAGIITAISGTPYSVLEVNRGLKIFDAENKSGGYIIKSIDDAGWGFGSRIVVSPAFQGPNEIIYGTSMVMGTWWEQWNGDVNESNVLISNTMLVGGKDHISYNDGGGSTEAWRGGFVGDAYGFITRQFLSLSNGRLLLPTTGNKDYNQKNYILNSDDIGKNWSILKDFSEIKGKIFSSTISDFNNTVLIVEYTQPIDFYSLDGSLDQQEIAIFSSQSNISIYRGKVIGNQKNSSGKNEIIVFGNEANNVILGDSYTFIVYPLKINTLIETDQQTVMFGTDKGIYYDVNTAVSNIYPEGTIVSVGISGVVSKIDISGTIFSIATNAATGNSVLSVTTDTPIRGKDLIGKSMYIIDTNPVEKYTISDNGSFSPGDEATIEVSVTSSLSNNYVGKRFRIAGNSSRIYVNFNLPVLNNQFDGGKITIISNEGGNYGSTYNIISNTNTYIDLGSVLVPDSTLVERDGITGVSSKSALQVGQTIGLLDSTNNLVLWVSMDREIKENALVGLSFYQSNIPAARDIGKIDIISNLKNSITLKTSNITSLRAGDAFVIRGTMFEQLGGFSHLKTSVNDGHYHDVETVNAYVTGKIGSFGTTNDSYVDINVVDTEHFSDALVQLRGDLFEDAKIIFTNDNAVNLRYISDVVSHDATSIRVRIKASSYWNFTSADYYKVSVGWKWEIDATNYGYTSGITYDDFVVFGRGIAATISIGSTDINVDSTLDLNIGDKIMVQDDTGSYEIRYISLILGDTSLRVSTSFGRTYFLSKNPQMKVLRDVFANTHLHQIRNNEVQVVTINDYLDVGYSADHSHRILSLVENVSALLTKENGDIVSMGSGSSLYNSSDNGLTWTELIDLDDFIENGEEVDGVSSATLSNNHLYVGATNGSIFAEVDDKYGIVRLRKVK